MTGQIHWSWSSVTAAVSDPFRPHSPLTFHLSQRPFAPLPPCPCDPASKLTRRDTVHLRCWNKAEVVVAATTEFNLFIYFRTFAFCLSIVNATWQILDWFHGSVFIVFILFVRVDISVPGYKRLTRNRLSLHPSVRNTISFYFILLSVCLLLSFHLCIYLS